MKIHADNLSSYDLREAVPSGVILEVSSHGSRKRDHAFEVRLSAVERDALHRYATNSGSYGAGTDIAATWDEWGLFIAALFKREPTAIIGQYDGQEDFISVTAREQSRVAAQYEAGSVYSRTHTAPWLND